MAYAYLATQVPTPTGPTQAPTLIGCSASGNQVPGGLQFLSTMLGGGAALAINQQVTQAYLNATGAHGFAIREGLQIQPVTGLTIQITAGHAAFGVPVEIAQNPLTGQTLPRDVLPDNTSIVFVWLFQNGTIAHTTTTAPPPVGPGEDPPLYLGNCTTSGGNITQVDYSGVMYLRDGNLVRFTNDTLAPADTPNAARNFRTITNGGTWEWDGGAHRQLVDGTKLVMGASGVQILQGLIQMANVQALTGTLSLTLTSNRVQHLTSASGETVNLPPSSMLSLGDSFTIYNDNPGGGSNITVTDHTGLITICSIGPGHFAVFPSLNSNGAAVWPSAVTSQSTPSTGPSLVQTGVNVSNGVQSGLTVSTPHPPSTGNFVVAIILLDSGHTVSTVNNGGSGFSFSKVASGSGSAHEWEIWTSAVGVGSPVTAYTIVPSTGCNIQAAIIEVNSVSTLDVDAYNESSTGTTQTTGTTGATATASEIAVALIGGSQSGAASNTFSGPTNGYMIAGQVTNPTGLFGTATLLTKILSSTGAQSTGVTSSQSVTTAAGIIATFK